MRLTRGPLRPLVLALGAAAGALGALAALGRLDAVEVGGRSMAPTLLPGDRLLVESLTFARRQPRAGDVVLAADPREPGRELVKRVAAAADGFVELAGDDPGASTDSRSFGAVPVEAIRWRVLVRYWPPGRMGSVS